MGMNIDTSTHKSSPTSVKHALPFVPKTDIMLISARQNLP